MSKDDKSKGISDQSQNKTVKYKLRPIFMQVIGAGMMITGAILVLLPIMNSLTGTDSVPDIRKVDFGTVEEEIDDKIQEGISTVRVNAATVSADDKSSITETKIRVTGQWVATDYHPGDIGVGSYEVKLGDTLWEISEAVYGDGNMWGKILERNKENIGYLPDGTQALIIPGQKLSIAK